MTKPKALTMAVLATISLALTSMILIRAAQVRAASSASDIGQRQSPEPFGGEPATDDVIDQAEEPADERARARRRAKNRRYDTGSYRHDRRLTDLPSGVGAIRGSTNTETPPPPPLPAAESDVVIVGTIRHAQPYLTESQTSMYTEFAIQVEEVLKNDARASITVGSIIEADREAGAMRLRDGRVIRFKTAGAGRLPRIGRQYVLFLKRVNDGQDLSILRGYELRQGRVFPLDGETRVYMPETGQITRIAPFEGAAVTSFLDLVRAVIANPGQAITPEGGSR